MQFPLFLCTVLPAHSLFYRSKMLLAWVVALTATVAAHPSHHPHPLAKRAMTGVATFNNYAAQGNTNCGKATGACSLYLIPQICWAAPFCIIRKVSHSDQRRSIWHLWSCGIRHLSRYLWWNLLRKHRHVKMRRTESSTWLPSPWLPQDKLREVLQSDEQRRYGRQ